MFLYILCFLLLLLVGLTFFKIKHLKDQIADQKDRIAISERALIKDGQFNELGKQTAQMVHELNNAISAITTNLKTISEAMTKEISLWQDISPEIQSIYLMTMVKLVQTSYTQQKKGLSTKERRIEKRKLEKHFDEDDLIDTFSFLQVYDQLEAYDILISSAYGRKCLDLVVCIVERVAGMIISVKSINQVDNILHALKTFSYTNERNNDNAPMEFDIEKSLTSVLTLYQGKLKHIKVTITSEKLPLVLGYPQQLIQVWANVLSNAIYANKGRGNIYIRLKNLGSNIVVELEDEGGGITADIQNSLFEDFRTTKPQGEGTGLGLSISKRILERHKGEISAINKNKGAVFSVLIPVNSFQP